MTEKKLYIKYVPAVNLWLSVIQTRWFFVDLLNVCGAVFVNAFLALVN